MNNTEIATTAYYDAEKASMLLNNVAYELKRLTCEVANDLDEDNVKSPILKLEEMNIHLDKEMNLSQAHVAYTSILKSYKMFLRKSRNILFGKGKNKKKSKNKNGKQWTD